MHLEMMVESSYVDWRGYPTTTYLRRSPTATRGPCRGISDTWGLTACWQKLWDDDLFPTKDLNTLTIAHMISRSIPVPPRTHTQVSAAPSSDTQKTFLSVSQASTTSNAPKSCAYL